MNFELRIMKALVRVQTQSFQNIQNFQSTQNTQTTYTLNSKHFTCLHAHNRSRNHNRSHSLHVHFSRH